MITKLTYIYALLEPAGNVRYVGKSDIPYRRFERHLCDQADTRKARWVRSLLRRGDQPRLLIIEAARRDCWQERERYWIAQFKSVGADLTNSSDGGIGPLAPLPETRMKMRAAKLGGKLTIEHRAKVSAALRGRAKPPRTEEHAAALSASCAGRSISTAHRIKLAAANMRRPAASALGLKGVYYDRHRGKYQALIKVGQKIIHLGRYAIAADAAKAYNAAALAHGWPAEGLNNVEQIVAQGDMLAERAA